MPTLPPPCQAARDTTASEIADELATIYALLYHLGLTPEPVKYTPPRHSSGHLASQELVAHLRTIRCALEQAAFDQDDAF